MTTQTQHSSWCTDHRTYRDRGEVDEVCRSSVTVSGITVDIEDCPTWPDDERRQVVPPDLPDTWVNPADARALAAALVEAARLIDDRD